MNVLLIGSGGREHAIAWKLHQSRHLTRLFIAPGNPGTSLAGTNLNLPVNDFAAIRQAVLDNDIRMVVVGPEDPLVNGIHDFFLNDPSLKNIAVIGPAKAGAMLEGSKDFAKDFMTRHGIPTAPYQTFSKDNLEEGFALIGSTPPPYVLKADGLAAGKGVVICHDQHSALEELKSMITGARFGEASSQVVIEQFLTGIEVSVFVLTDGKSYVLLPEAKDYKKIGEGDTGPNTGGMGSVSPVGFADETFMEKVRSRIIEPTLKGLQEEHIPYVGFIFFGLINVKGDPFVIEYNCRMGDPETESVMPRLKTDLLEMLIAASEGSLDKLKVEFDPRPVATVMLVSGGYPEKYEKGKIISGLDNTGNSMVFHAGTAFSNEDIITSGGRVLAVTSFGDDLREALSNAYREAEKISFGGMYYRKDIGFDLK